jgi:hypothetical protein
MQNARSQTSSKHFIGKQQESHRSNSILENGTEIVTSSANIGDQTLHELCFWLFADMVGADTLSVMCSYNRLFEKCTTWSFFDKQTRESHSVCHGQHSASRTSRLRVS